MKRGDLQRFDGFLRRQKPAEIEFTKLTVSDGPNVVDLLMQHAT